MLKSSLFLLLLLLNFLAPRPDFNLGDFQSDFGVLENSLEYNLTRLDSPSSAASELRKDSTPFYIAPGVPLDKLGQLSSLRELSFSYAHFSSKFSFPHPEPRGPPSLLI